MCTTLITTPSPWNTEGIWVALYTNAVKARRTARGDMAILSENLYNQDGKYLGYNFDVDLYIWIDD